MDSPDIYGNLYFVVILDRSTDFFWHLPLKSKVQFYKVFDVFIEVVLKTVLAKQNRTLMEEWNKHAGGKGLLLDSSANLQRKMLSRLRRIRCDCGSEFANKDFTALLEKNSATLCASNPYVNDGRAEAIIKKIVTLTRCCLIEANLRKAFWGPVSDMVVQTLLRTYNPTKKWIPFEKLTGVKPDVSYLRMPGCMPCVTS